MDIDIDMMILINTGIYTRVQYNDIDMER